MPLKQAAKRKASTSNSSDATSSASPKKAKRDNASNPLGQPHHLASVAEDNDIVLRKYYPAEMSNARAHAYNNNEIPRPIEQLTAALEETAEARKSTEVKDAVVHWFKADLRTADNRALWEASEKARAAGVPLICLYIVSPEDFEAHLTAPVRVDFILRTLAVLRADLAALDIPLHVETVARRRDVPERVLALARGWGASHLFANMEYEVDELRREAALVRAGAARGLAVDVLHDTCVVPPGALRTSAGRQYAVYSPWFRSWVAHAHANPELLGAFDPPARNPPAARDSLAALFEGAVPEAPEGKRLVPGGGKGKGDGECEGEGEGEDEKKRRLRALWPAGEAEAARRLQRFCEDKIARYKDQRNFPATAATSSISVHLAAGTLSARAAVRAARDANKTDKLDGGDEGIRTWISEVAWRDFYKHVLVNWPYVCMNKPFKPEYSDIEWSYDASHFAAWCEGRTGFPIVDAAMRQLRETGWMHNRCRMVTASFLAKDLLVDWRMGERFFMEHLVDGDFASNSGGWGFGASVGVDPQPYFRVFNPLLQSEKFDRGGAYIRRWVPELRGVKDRAVHDPYGRGAGDHAKKMGYPEPIVQHQECRLRALGAYKAALERDKP